MEEVSGNIQAPATEKKSGFMSAITLPGLSIKDWLQSRRENVRPWNEFINTAKISKPKSATEVGQRVFGNLRLYQSNYLFVFIGLVIYCLITSPLLLVGVGVMLAGCYYIGNHNSKLSLMGREFTTFHQYILLAMLCVPLFLLAGATTAVFWVIGASVFVIMLHASMMAIEPSTADDSTDLTMDNVV